MTWIDRITAVSIVCISIVVSFSIFEYSYRYLWVDSPSIDFKHRTMLYATGENFKNYDGYFKYFPNKEIRSTTIYSRSEMKSIEDLVIVYDYLVRTNNIGLVMQNDVLPNDSSIFVIGDSFTEGQGASPWFYDLENTFSISKSKILNLGILGTGPQQWENLASAITKEFQLDVRAIVINVIPADMARGVWTFHPRELDCLHHTLCDYKLGFQGYEFKEQESYDDIKRSILGDLGKPEQAVPTSETIITKLKKIIKMSRVAEDLYHYYIRSNIVPNREPNEASLLALKKAVSGNFYVNVVSQKGTDSSNYENNKNATKLIEFLQRNKIRYKWCDIPAAGFHRYDSHPNADGYKVLRKCTQNALEQFNL